MISSVVRVLIANSDSKFVFANTLASSSDNSETGIMLIIKEPIRGNINKSNRIIIFFF